MVNHFKRKNIFETAIINPRAKIKKSKLLSQVIHICTLGKQLNNKGGE